MQKRRYSRSLLRPFGARWVADCVQFGQLQHGSSARSRRSSPGLTRMQSNKGESNFIAYYAKGSSKCASLTELKGRASRCPPPFPPPHAGKGGDHEIVK